VTLVLRVAVVATALGALTLGARTSGLAAPPESREVQFLFTSDAHYGLTRAQFRGHANVDAHVVNAAMIGQMNRVPGLRLPDDGGVGAGELVGPIDFVVEGGDVANREESRGSVSGGAIQAAVASWRQFEADYVGGLRTENGQGERSALFVVPGNHDVSNAIGFHAPMTPPTDRAALVGIYNLMMRPGAPMTATTYRYPDDRVLASRDISGVHLIFDTVWPDSRTREWMDDDLRKLAPSTPALLFTHDQPEAEAKHFTNPNPPHDINAVDKFENLLTDQFQDGATIDRDTAIEQHELERFLGAHPNIRSYFHGNSNWNEFYNWTGPQKTLALPVFRVDSPMKGRVSSSDERRLSFQVATIDRAKGRMTVRECLWNAHPDDAAALPQWGMSRTVSLAVPTSAPPRGV
jgi:hypothetical protein